MKLDQPRIHPLKESEWTDEQRKLLTSYKEKGVYNVVGTLSQHWEGFMKFRTWSGHVLGETSTLPAREREILILRIGWLCQAEYEWGQHAIIGKKAGLTDDELEAIKEGSDAPNWSELDSLLIKSVDELNADKIISKSTWEALRGHYSKQQIMDVIFTVGQYNMVSMFLNSCGVQLDVGVKGF